jgi:multiple sugar transport system substrate-binding protein
VSLCVPGSHRQCRGLPPDWLRRLLLAAVAVSMSACGPAPDVLTFSGSVLGAEGAIVRRQVERFAALHPELPVEVRVTPDSADARHQLYVQWLNAWSPQPDVLQLDVIWTPEFAAAGWILPLDRFAPDTADVFPAALTANRWQGRLFAMPWLVDVGMLYWRTDLLAAAPSTFDDLAASVRTQRDRGAVSQGFVWQGARYEGLVCVFLEYLSAFGGQILDDRGAVVVDSSDAIRALTYMHQSIAEGVVPRAVLTWQEEQTRFAFQNGNALFLRNWPYAASLMNEEAAVVRKRFAVAPMPGAGGRRAAALGGAQLAINARSQHPESAWLLIEYLTAPAQLLERAQATGQFPARRGLYENDQLANALPVPPADARVIIDRAIPRPVTPVYTELSGELQIHLHRALTDQERPDEALTLAAERLRAILRRAGLAGSSQ